MQLWRRFLNFRIRMFVKSAVTSLLSTDVFDLDNIESRGSLATKYCRFAGLWIAATSSGPYESWELPFRRFDEYETTIKKRDRERENADQFVVNWCLRPRQHRKSRFVGYQILGTLSTRAFWDGDGDRKWFLFPVHVVGFGATLCKARAEAKKLFSALRRKHE